jgi:hypothetical protein
MRATRRLLCVFGFHAFYECDPECCGTTLCLWCSKEKTP